MTIFVILSYFIVVMPVGPSSGRVWAQAVPAGVTAAQVCAEAKRQHGEAWEYGVAYPNDGMEGVVLRKPVDCIVHLGPDGKPRKDW